MQANAQFAENFDNPSRPLLIRGRGDCRTTDGVFRSQSAYACFGDETLRNCRITFSARAPKDAEQVQIWAGFRAANRFDRYVLGMKGGLQDDLYLSRMGYMGADELLSLSPLDFHPETGVWYRFRIETCRNRIRVFLNDEQLPRIDVEDANAGLAPQGYVTLGGGWITTEFDSLRIEPLDETALDNIPVRTYATVVPANAKENRRQAERASYTPVALDRLPSGRSEIALDGHWLFLPDYEVKGVRPEKPETGDQNWHVMTVPSFWNPIRIWLHGETMNQGKFPKGVSDTYYQQETARCEAYTFDYKKIKAAWYRQWIDLPQGMENKTVELQFDAVSKMADIYVNGVLVASHTGMFGEIKTDITKYLKAGKNLIAAYVVKDYAGDSGKSEEPDYYTIARLDEHPEKAKELEASATVTGKMLKDIAHGFYGGNPAGIWQPVKLIVASRIKIDDVFIRPTLDGASFEVTVKNYSGQKQNISLSTDIFEKETNHLFYSETSLSKIALKAGEERVLSYAVQGLQPRLWSPQSPSLYDFTFKIRTAKGAEEDAFTVRSGFRTFEVKDGLFHLNGKPYWLRGGNHTPFALAPNDATLANSFYQIMKAGNIDVTRTHTSPYNKLWVNAADENGIGISHEGTWPWLMINASMPDSTLIRMWADEYLSLLKKYRNHPSILFWTINNEMKFYDNEPNPAKRQLKMTIISDVVKRIREIDPTRPISFDSNYRRNEAKLGKAFYEGIDDGDIDDVHSYINWYDHTLFKQFNGEFQRDHKNEGRPLISQEMSTGYPNNETGHPTRFYTLVHQNPQTLVGYEAYAFGNPDYFLKTQAFITGELAEALRRSSDRASGIIHFALLTWFRNVYDAKNIEPYPAYYAMQRALQPALVSAELWGRNFYAGEKLPARICVV
ncbi:MAG: glycoside hydrolase family 2, partial [Dysgonamonadaceae bacterium]|nr:glycoside hydrolase family 2 [Dysgonamonadaceae bacterium]